ncbi:hypothetical protein [Viridibacillus arvi]|uniref:hypothetical protein n=1 Tax=Viridibacillus arvi TaxID=263475 RepID=UPI003D2DE172
MSLYSKPMLEKMDDTYENEFSLPILTKIIPFQISEFSELDCRGQIKKLLSQDYKILIQTPNLPKRKFYLIYIYKLRIIILHYTK